jgi:hypothetical protein
MEFFDGTGAPISDRGGSVEHRLTVDSPNSKDIASGGIVLLNQIPENQFANIGRMVREESHL